MDRFQQVRFTSCHSQRLTAALDYLRSDAPEDERPPKPGFLIACEKPLPARQMEHPHPRLQYIYGLIHSALALGEKTLRENFQEEWGAIKSQSCIKRWKQDDAPWLSFKHDLMCKWMDSVIAKIAPMQAWPGVAAELAAPTDSPDVVPPAPVFGETPPPQGPPVQELLVPLQPARVDFDLKPLEAWFAKFGPLPRLPSLHAEMVAGLRATSADKLQEISTEAIMTLKHEPLLHKVQAELLDLNEKKKLLAMCTVKAAALTANSVRAGKEKKLQDATLQVIGWREDMQAYEDATQDYLASLDLLQPSRSLQANIVFQGRVRFLNLLTNLADDFVAVRKLVAHALAQRRGYIKDKSLKECGVSPEFHCDAGTIDLTYDEVAQELRIREETMNTELAAVYSIKELKELLDLFVRFPVLTHTQVLKLVPPAEDFMHSTEEIRSQLIGELPLVAVKLQYQHKRLDALGHLQYIYAPALNGAAFAHFIHLLSAAESMFNPKKVLRDAILVENDPDAVESFQAWKKHNELQEQSGQEANSSGPGPGRPRLSDDRCLGKDLRTVVQNFVHARGQVSQEPHRRKVSGNVFGAPLPLLAKTVSKHFGRKVS